MRKFKKLIALCMALVMLVAVMPITAGAEDPHNLNLSVTGSGTISGAGLSGTGGTASVAYGDSVSITQTASSGYEFVSWSVSGVTTDTTGASLSFTMPDNDVTISAEFQPITTLHNVTVIVRQNQSTMGSIISPATSNLQQTFGQQVTIAAQAYPTYQFVSWNVISGGANIAAPTSINTYFTMPNNSVVIEAVFSSTTPVVTGLSAAPTTIAATATGANRDSVITVTGTNLPATVTVGAFLATSSPNTPAVGGSNGTPLANASATGGTATLTFGPAQTAPREYTIMFSLDGGTTFQNIPSVHTTTVTVAGTALPVVSNVSASPTTIAVAATGANRNSTITVTGTNLPANVRVGAFLTGNTPAITSNAFTPTATGGTATLTFGAATAATRTYTIRVSTDGGSTWLPVNAGVTSATVTVTGTAIPTISTVTASPTIIPSNATGRNSTITVTGTNLSASVRVGAFLPGNSGHVPDRGGSNGVAISSINTQLTSGSASIPLGSAQSSARQYTIRISRDGGATFLNSPTTTVTVAATGTPVTAVTANPATIAANATNRNSVITVTGTNIVHGDVRVGAFAPGNNTNNPTIGGTNGVALGSGASATGGTATLTFGASQAAARTYNIRVSLDRGSTWLPVNAGVTSTTVTVASTGIPVTSVSIIGGNFSLEAGATRQLEVSVSPANATNRNVAWSSNNTSVATVSANGVVTGRATGTATITATSQDNSAISSSITVTVTPATQFNDIAGHWAIDAINTVTSAGLFQGTAPGVFSPQSSMTRAMFAQVLANLEGANTGAYTANFNDVSSGAWYFGTVGWAADSGIITGVGNGNFAPNTPVTREQMAVMLYRYAEIKGITLPSITSGSFTDQGNISYWAVDAVSAVQAAGIVTGRPDGRFDPQATATRAEVATIFARFLEIV